MSAEGYLEFKMPEMEENLEFGRRRQLVVKTEDSHAIPVHGPYVLCYYTKSPNFHCLIPSESLSPPLCGRFPEAGQEHRGQVLQMSKAATSTSVSVAAHINTGCQCSPGLLRACDWGSSIAGYLPT